MLQGQPLKQVSECVYLGVVLMDNLACTSDMNGQNVLFSSNIIQYTKNQLCWYQRPVISFRNARYVILWHINLVYESTQKKDQNNISVVYHKAIKRICGRISYDSNHECMEYARLPIFKLFLARKFICYAHRLFIPKSPCLMIHKHYLKYNSVFRNSFERFFSENYHVTNVFDNPLCSIMFRIDFVQRT